MFDFIQIALTKVVNERGLPFDMRVPNAETLENFEKTDKGEAIYKAKDIEDLFSHLNV